MGLNGVYLCLRKQTLLSNIFRSTNTRNPFNVVMKMEDLAHFSKAQSPRPCVISRRLFIDHLVVLCLDSENSGPANVSNHRWGCRVQENVAILVRSKDKRVTREARLTYEVGIICRSVSILDKCVHTDYRARDRVRVYCTTSPLDHSPVGFYLP
jgi:hypothetical protein